MPNIAKAASYIGKKVYSQPYLNTKGGLGAFFRANFYLKVDGTTIHRPNHNIANILRSLIYLQPIIDYYTINGNDETKKNITLIDADEIEKIRYILTYYTSYRENEQADSDQFVRGNVFAHLRDYFESCNSFAPFKDVAEVEHYVNLLRAYHDGNREGKDKIIALLLSSCHHLDLLRCFSDKILKITTFQMFNENSEKKNTRNLQSLIFYAQNCIVATGDKLRTKYQVQAIHGSHHQQGFHLHLRTSKTRPTHTGNNAIEFCAESHNGLRFKEACRVDEEGIYKTLQNLEKIPKPLFFPDIKSGDSYDNDTEKSLELIKQGNGVIRNINGNVNAISLRFELEQLVNPNFMRPIRQNKLRKVHTEYYDLATHEGVIRPEKDYVEISTQEAIVSPRDIPPYVSNKAVSKQEDRGKPKKTIFSKKQSYSLLPENGLFPMFNGRFKDRIASSYITVGILHDLEKMHHKGERYIWADDVRSSGINGYFWLNTEKKRSYIPYLDTVRYDGRCSIANLKKTLQTNDFDKFNEMLMGASRDSLSALFATQDDRLHRLAALHAAAVLSHDYGVTRPVLIVTGKSKPTAYTSNQIQTDLTQSIEKYRKWYWRLAHRFISTTEQQVLLEIIGLVSSNGLKVNNNELTQYFTVAKNGASGIMPTPSPQCTIYPTAAAASDRSDHSSISKNVSHGMLSSQQEITDSPDSYRSFAPKF